MAGLRDPQRYRDEVALFLRLAEAFADEAGLRDSYLALAGAYERLADALDRADREAGCANQVSNQQKPRSAGKHR